MNKRGAAGGGASPYRMGAEFERAAGLALVAAGYVVKRVAGSKQESDLVALKADENALLVQCKRDGYLPLAEWHALLRTAERAGALPVLALRNGRGIEFWWLTGEAVPNRPRPMIRLQISVAELPPATAGDV